MADANNSTTLVISSTFDSSLLREPLQYWLAELEIPTVTHLAPYNTVLQQLLDPQSPIAENTGGVTVFLIRISDWVPKAFINAAQASLVSQQATIVAKSLHELSGRGCRFIVCICPECDDIDGEVGQLCSELAQQIAEQLRGESRIALLDIRRELQTYGVSDIYCRYTDRIAAIPYTAAFFAALGTALARNLYRMFCGTAKVLVLDCDNTIWQGNCGEMNPAELVIDDRTMGIQLFALRCLQNGMVLCLCSKNDPETVEQAFQGRPDMPLSLTSFAARIVSWHPKAESLAKLSRDLGIALDKFILLDDDPLECAEVIARCPGVVAYNISRWEHPKASLEHLWPCDSQPTTVEDVFRNEWYQKNVSRAQLSETMSYEAFLESLELRLNIHPLEATECERVLQLLKRARQFNTRRSPVLIGNPLSSENAYTVSAHDCFGDYGLVGVCVISKDINNWEITQIAMSCRALGKHIEDSFLMDIVRRAHDSGVNDLRVLFESTSHNAYARRFLTGVCSQKESTDMEVDSVFCLDGAELLRPGRSMTLSYGARFATEDQNASQMRDTHKVGDESEASKAIARAEVLARLPIELNTADKILAAVTSKRSRFQSIKPIASPQTPIEREVVGIWWQLLGNDSFTTQTDLFDIVADSLLAVQVLAAIDTQFHVQVPIGLIFDDGFTVTNLARFIEAELVKRARASDLAWALQEVERLSDEELTRLLWT